MSYRSHGIEQSPDTPRDGAFLLSPTTPLRGVPYEITSTSIPSSTASKAASSRERWKVKIHWYEPASMILVFLCGCLGAIGHHLFYSSLHGKPAHNQLTMTRIGVGLAFLTKVALVGSVVLAYRQRVWKILREKTVSLKGLDALFSVVEDPIWFFMGHEMFAKAKVATLMALATWLIPLASVLASGALTAQLIEVSYPNESCYASTLNFSQEAVSDWRSTKKKPGYQLAFWNTTPPPPDWSHADWYDQPSYQTQRLTTLAFYWRSLLSEETSPCHGFNCTYTLVFDAPWYNCSRVQFSDLPEANFNATSFVPDSPPLASNGSNYIYKAHSPESYPRPYPNYDSRSYTGQGTFTSDLIIHLAFVVNTTTPISSATEATRWNYTMEPQAWTCIHQRAKYTVLSQWTDNRLKSRRAQISDGVSMLRRGESLGPRTDSMERYKEYVAYYTVGDIIRQTLDGTIVQDNQTQGPVTHTDLSKTRLVDAKSQYPVENFISAFQRFYEDLILSFISEPNFEIGRQQDTPCYKRRYENRFDYSRSSLWSGYSFVIFVSLVCVTIGGVSLHSNGYASNTTFSKIMVTTRNPTLDYIVMQYPGVSLGGEPMPRELEELQLRFGTVAIAGKDGVHTAFGLAEETGRIQKEIVERATEAQLGSGVQLGSRNAWSWAGMDGMRG